MLCFLRWLDDDCDGYVSQKDFCRVVLGMGQANEGTPFALWRLGEQWHAAAEALPVPFRSPAARGGWSRAAGLVASQGPDVAPPQVLKSSHRVDSLEKRVSTHEV